MSAQLFFKFSLSIDVSVNHTADIFLVASELSPLAPIP
jgi:hypothetical protein